MQPLWDRHVQEQRRISMLDQWNTWKQLETVSLGSSKGGVIHSVTITEPKVQESGRSIVPEPVKLDGYPVLGVLSIEALNMEEPIVEGADPESLKTGVGTVVPGRSPGSTGNYVIAGHRSWTYGKQFSRLDELAAGDSIKLDTRDDTYVYSVTSKFLVKPDDLSVLEQSKDKAELTLITCEPKYNPTHRLIVKAVLKGKAMQ
ncbi:class D sortase [Paenibacillus sp. NPDC056579]|uniref:class D sortase n=1 Tax=Paenibacillus sp. NPDC056579 TaxID=3345871 RepID=UPI0036893216